MSGGKFGWPYHYTGQYQQVANLMLFMRDNGDSFADIGRKLANYGIKNAYGDQLSGGVVASVIKMKLRERAENSTLPTN